MKKIFFYIMLLITLSAHGKKLEKTDIPLSYKACTKDNDCMIILPRCDKCCEVEAINTQFEKPFKDLYIKTCGPKEPPVCACGGGLPPIAKCVSLRCVTATREL